MTKQLLLVAGLVLSPLVVVEAGASDFQIAVQRKKVSETRGQKLRTVPGNVAQEVVRYDVTVNNRAFGRASKEVQARYIIFVERQEVGEKQGTERSERVRGEAKVEEMQAMGKTTFQTSEVTLRTQSLGGGYVFSDGGRIRATDSLQGIWIKLFDGEEEVGEYINPTSLRNKIKWE